MENDGLNCIALAMKCQKPSRRFGFESQIELYYSQYHIVMEDNMQANLNDLNQVRALVDMLAVAMEDANGQQFISKMLETGLKWLATKQRDYKGDAYFEQIEKNAVYLQEAAMACDRAFAIFICRGEPILTTNEQISFYVQTQRVAAQETMPLHLSFIRSGCSGCSAHEKHNLYISYQTMRKDKNRAAYIEELEFACIYYQVMFIASQYFLTGILRNPDHAGIARKLSPDQVATIIDERIGIRTQLWSGLVEITTAQNIPNMMQNAPAKKPWRQIWGDKFDWIARKL